MNRNSKVKNGMNKIPLQPLYPETTSQPRLFTINFEDTLSFRDGAFVELHSTIKEPDPSPLQRLRATLAAPIAATFVVMVIRELLKKSDRTVSRPPGSTLLALADFLCSKKTIEEITKPLIADMQFEYNDALFAGRKVKAAWIRLRCAWSFFMAIGLYQLLKFVAKIFLRSTAR